MDLLKYKMTTIPTKKMFTKNVKAYKFNKKLSSSGNLGP